MTLLNTTFVIPAPDRPAFIDWATGRLIPAIALHGGTHPKLLSIPSAEPGQLTFGLQFTAPSESIARQWRDTHLPLHLGAYPLRPVDTRLLHFTTLMEIIHPHDRS